jgi:hypothetical protein
VKTEKGTKGQRKNVETQKERKGKNEKRNTNLKIGLFYKICR